MMAGHGDYHPAMGRSFSDKVNIEGGRPRLRRSRVMPSWRESSTPTKSAKSRRRGPTSGIPPFLIGWDEPGGTYDHVTPRTGAPPPGHRGLPGECDFTFDRSGYRVPAVIVSPWVEPGSVYNEEYRHTSLLATLREG